MMGNLLLPTPFFDTSACGQQQLLTFKLSLHVYSRCSACCVCCVEGKSAPSRRVCTLHLCVSVRICVLVCVFNCLHS